MAYNKKLLYVSEVPVWITEAGSLGEFIQDGSPISNITLSAAEFFNDVINYSVTSGSLPTGLSLNSSTGVISGTISGYSDVSTLNFSITATDSEGEKAIREFSIKVSPEVSIDYLVVAGGGGGGRNRGGGGGAGGYKTSNLSVGSGTLSITIGAGGGGAAGGGNSGASGNNSLISYSTTTLTAIGGGGGGGQYTIDGKNGGSGGGGGTGGSYGSGTSGQGNRGGSAGLDPYATMCGGGGGATQVGFNGTSSGPGNGGNGLSSNVITTTIATQAGVGEVSGSSVYFCGGGGGGSSTGTTSSGGLGGGGNGCSNNFSCSPGPAMQFTGGGGGGNGGGGGGTPGSGASGVAVLRLLTSRYSGVTTGSPEVYTDGLDTVLIYKGSGTYTI